VLAVIGLVLGAKLAAIDDLGVRGIGAACILFGLAICAAMVHLCRGKIVLRADALEVHHLTGKTLVSRDEILGFTKCDGEIVFELRGGRRRLSLPLIANADEEFESWISSVANLDAAVEAEDQSQPAGSPQPGTNFLHLCWFVVMLLVIFWAMFYPRPYGLVMTILISFPFVELALVQALGAPSWFASAQGDISYSLALSGIFLTLHAMMSNVYHSHEVVLLSVGLGLITGSILSLADRRLLQRSASILILIILLPLYGYGAGVQINRLLDSSPATVFEAKVGGMERSKGSRLPPQVELVPWGPDQISTIAWVARPVYESIKPGDTVCVQLHRGALLVRWYVVRTCAS